MRMLPRLRSALAGFFLLFLIACSPGSEDVDFVSGQVRLAGTFYLPKGEGPHPALVLVHGSGPDRRENYRLYADMFARSGIAVLIYDKRGVGDSTGDWTRSSFERLVDDAQAAIAFLQRDTRIDARRVGIWGGSEGAVVAAWAAARSSRIAFVIMQSAPGMSFAEQNLFQTERQLRALGLPEREVSEGLRFQALKHRYARTSTGWPEYARALEASRREPWAGLGGPSQPNDWWWTWYRTKMDASPLPFLERVRAPIFAVWGSRDQLLPAYRSRNAVRATLKRAGHRSATLLVIPEADHSLNTPSGPNPSPAYTDAMLEWVRRIVA